MNIDEALPIYIEESREQLSEMEDLLMQLEQNPDDSEAMNALFRAVHTIKGSGGLFALDHVVAFTHVVESVLDRLRMGEIKIDGKLAASLLHCRDHIAALIDHVEMHGATPPTDELPQKGGQLLQQLQNYQEKPDKSHSMVEVEASAQLEIDSESGCVSTDNWHISMRFAKDVLRNGMDPLSFIHYLNTIGSVVSIVTLLDAIPDIEEMDPESCYLGLEMSFKSNASHETIASAFDFIREDSIIRILPPHSKLADYIELIQTANDEDMRLGEILVASGSLTQAELKAGLSLQEGIQGGETPPLGEVLIDQHFSSAEDVGAALHKQEQIRETKKQENAYVRVLADKLDSLINLVGELVIAGAGAHLLAKRLGDPALLESTSVISHLVGEVRDSALHLRMVEIGDTFNRFRRVVHDVSHELGKEIELQISGSEAELDKTVVEKISDPLMHLVRNAIDHGIEPIEVRRAKGKPDKGTLKLNAYHDSGNIIIEVSDDGGGLDRDKILRLGIERGIVQANQNLSDHDIYQLIFEPGFSTAEKVTQISGRGVGMDVVKRNITSLRGSVDLTSTPGQGSTISIRLPLTLAIIDGFLVGVGDASYVVPLDMMVECTELTQEEKKVALERNYINLRGEVLPFLRLRNLFSESSSKNSRRENIVVVETSGIKAGLMVDELLGEFQTVIKPLGNLFSNLQGISGSTILGSGEVALILDVPGLIRLTTSRDRTQTLKASSA